MLENILMSIGMRLNLSHVIPEAYISPLSVYCWRLNKVVTICDNLLPSQLQLNYAYSLLLSNIYSLYISFAILVLWGTGQSEHGIVCFLLIQI